jgi:glutamine phosphoribosylpyrophosphate amidotransferase|tara:strand:+ start:2507 stop:3148 length:642 start_codon:yes stop_codon:yes gene_type:complete
MFEVLYEANKARGTFASSVCSLRDTSQHLVKAEGAIDFDKFMIDSEADYFFGHVQAPTSKKRIWDSDTSHPFDTFSWMVCHNGVLTNDDNLRDLIKGTSALKDNPVDTSVIGALLDQYHSDTALRLKPVQVIEKVASKLEGTFALSILLKETNELFITRVGSILHYDNRGNFSTMKGNGFKELKEGVIMRLNTRTSRWNKVGSYPVESPFVFI